MDVGCVDKNTGRGEQVTDHYLSGTVTNYREKSPLNWGDFKGESTSRNYLFNPSENFEKVWPAESAANRENGDDGRCLWHRRSEPKVNRPTVPSRRPPWSFWIFQIYRPTVALSLVPTRRNSATQESLSSMSRQGARAWWSICTSILLNFWCHRVWSIIRNELGGIQLMFEAIRESSLLLVSKFTVFVSCVYRARHKF